LTNAVASLQSPNYGSKGYVGGGNGQHGHV